MGKGKTNKIIWSAIGFALGFAFLGPVAGTAFKAGLMGASLFGTIWTAVNARGQENGNNGSPTVARFGRAQETMSSNGALPVIYGLRKITGNQTYHMTDADANTLHKHVVLCEGGIYGIQGVTANELLIPGNGLNKNTVFTVRNTKYIDARVWKEKKTLHLYCDGKDKTIYLCNKSDFQSDSEYWEWQTSVSALISYINRLNQGWQCFPVATTSKFPGDLTFSGTDESDGYDIVNEWVDENGAQHRSSPRKQFTTSGTTTTKYAIGQVYHLANGKAVQAATERECIMCNAVFLRVESDGTCWQSFGGAGQYIWEWQEKDVRGSCYNSFVIATAKTVTGGTNYTFHDGDLPSNYEEVGAYPHMAWLDITCCVADELSGNPSIACEVLGKKVYDTRTGKTEFTTNPAMCLRDFLLSPIYGLGHFVTADDLDEDSFKESADYCDEIIEFQQSDGSLVKAKRYEMNIVIDSRRNAWEWVSDMLASFSGFLVITQGKLMLKIERPSPIVYAFDESNCSDLKIAPIELEQVPNRYEVSFVDPLNNWDAVKAIVEDSADQHTRGKIITKDVQLEGVTSQHQALRLARFYRDYNASCVLNVSFKTGYQALHLQPGDVVKLTYKCFADFPLRINEIREDAEGGFEITGRQYNMYIYNDTLDLPIQAYNYATKDVPLGAVPEISNLTFKQYFFTDSSNAIHSEIQGMWLPPSNYDYVKEFAVYQKTEDGQWEQLLKTQGTSFKTNVTFGDTVQFKVCVVNTNDSLSTGIVSDVITIDGVDEPPDMVTGLTTIFADGRLHISWDANVELDLKCYVLSINGSIITTTETSVTAFAIHGLNKVTIQAEDYNGNKSEIVSTTIQLDLIPTNVMGFKAENIGNYIILSWYASERATYYEISGSISKEVYGGRSLLIPITSTGGYSYSIRAVNKYGASETSTDSVIVSSIEERNTIMSVNLLQDISCDKDCRMNENGKLTLVY